MFEGFGRIWEGLGPESWFWKDFVRLGAEIFDFVVVLERMLEGLRLKSLILFWFWTDLLEGLRLKSLMLFWFWKDFGGVEAEVFDFLRLWKDFGRLGAEILHFVLVLAGFGSESQ